jgi:predicted transcriptional regulator
MNLDELSEEEIYVVESLGSFGSRSFNDLAYTSDFKRPRLLNAVRDLREDGLVQYNSNRNVYNLTPKGVKLTYPW